MTVDGELRRTRAVAPPGSWDDPLHYLKALRSAWFHHLVKFQDCFSRSTTAYYEARTISALHLPITTGAISSPMGRGSDSTPVLVDLAGVPTYLADSMQFMLEFGCRLAPQGCYYLMPSFRGEANDETHLGQFYHSESEVPGGLDDVMRLAEEYVVELTRNALANCRPELHEVGAPLDRLEAVASGEAFRRITFDEAVAALGGSEVTDHGAWRTITRAGEHELMRRFGEPLWITHWDDLAVPFYQACDLVNGRFVARNADLLMGPGEVVGCGERHATGDAVRSAMARHEVGEHSYEWYVGIKDAAPMVTSGFGMGVERFLLWLTGHTDIRDIQLVPRENGKSASF